MWNSLREKALGTACPLRDVAWHPHQHVLALAGFGPDAPVLLYCGETRPDNQAKVRYGHVIRKIDSFVLPMICSLHLLSGGRPLEGPLTHMKIITSRGSRIIELIRLVVLTICHTTPVLHETEERCRA